MCMNSNIIFNGKHRLVLERYIPGRGLAPGDGCALLLPGEDGEGEPDVGDDEVDNVVGEAADEVAPGVGK